MSERFFILMLFLSFSNAWVLEVNDNQVTPHLTSDVTISCHSEPNDQSNHIFLELYRIRILKYINKGWKTVAYTTVRENGVNTSFPEANVAGNADIPSNTFLNITFNVATEDTVGGFVCEVDGFDEKLDIKAVKTKPVVVNEKNFTFTDVLDLLLEIRDQEMQDHSELSMIKDSVRDNSDIIHSITVRLTDLTDHVKLIEYGGGSKEESDNKLVMEIGNVTDSVESMKSDLKKVIIDNKETENKLTLAIGNMSDRVQSVESDIQVFTISKTQTENDLKLAIGTVNNSVESMKTDFNTIKINQKELRNQDQSALKIYISNINDQLEIVTEKQKDIVEAIHPLNITLTWPGGDYRLLRPDTGCPKNPNSIWQSGYLRISTQPGITNSDSISTPSNLSGGVLQQVNDNHYVRMEMCSMYDRLGPVWPKGSYCIQKHSATECPAGFKDGYGYIVYGRYDDGSVDAHDNIINIEKSSVHTGIFYCCRQDGSATSPIVLPRKHPFFLSRFGGRCQEVAGMTVSNQWIHTDTGKWGQNNMYDDNNDHPDGSITNGVTIQLCYYAPLV